MTFFMPILMLFFLMFYVNTDQSANNTTQLDNFTIEWLSFDIFKCVVPATIDISVFSCVAPNYTQVDDISCLNQTTVDFSETTCQFNATAPTVNNSIGAGGNDNQPLSITTASISITTQSSVTTTTTATQSLIRTTNTAAQPPIMTINAATQTSITPTNAPTQTSITPTNAPTQTSITPTNAPTQTSITPTNAPTQSSIRTTNAATQTSITATNAAAQTLIRTTNTAIQIPIRTTNAATQTSIRTTNAETQSSIRTTNTAIPIPIRTTNAVTQTSITTISTSITTQSPTTTKNMTAENPYYCPGESIGSFCNISADACIMSEPCLNAATCYPNNTLPLGYECACQSGYTGKNCQNDERICKENTCWNNGTCIEINSTISGDNGTSFQCQCEEAHTGIHCELKIDLCGNITCANKGICQTINLAWKCTCLNPTFYYGDYCQFQSSTLQVKKAMSRSFASIAITAISLTCSFVFLMDILKYVFHIDPAKGERQKLRQRKEQKRAAKSNASKAAIRFQYIA